MPGVGSLPHGFVQGTALYHLPFNDLQRRGNCETSKMQVILSFLVVVKCCAHGKELYKGLRDVVDKHQCKVVPWRNNAELAVSTQEQDLGVSLGSSPKSSTQSARASEKPRKSLASSGRSQRTRSSVCSCNKH